MNNTMQNILFEIVEYLYAKYGYDRVKKGLLATLQVVKEIHEIDKKDLTK